MTDLTSTKPGLNRFTKRFREVSETVKHAPFTGVLQPSFGLWIRNHLKFSTVPWFRPVAKDLYKPKRSSELLGQPRPQRVNVTNYTFNPIIKLTCFSENSTNSFFEVNGARIFQTLSLKFNDRRETKNYSGDRSVQINVQRSVDGSNRTDQTLVFRDRNRASELADIQQTKVDHAGFQDLISSLFSTVFHNTTGIARSFMTAIRLQREFNSASRIKRNEGPKGTMSPRFAVVDDLVNRRDLVNWLRTAAEARRLDQTFLTLTKRSETDSEGGYAARFFPTVSFNFKAPNVAEAELINQRIAHFVSSPSLNYAKREQGLSEGIVHALRDLRASQVNQKPIVIPQMPSIEQLTDQVKTQLERELRIERERRGI